MSSTQESATGPQEHEMTTEPNRYASLFTAITGQETITEAQQQTGRDQKAPIDADDVAGYVSDMTRQTGLEDAIDDPDTI